MISGWASMDKFWTARVKRNTKRCTFTANVVEPGLSGLTSCVPTAGQLDLLNATMRKFLRVLERRRGCTWKDVSDETGELVHDEPSMLQVGLSGMEAAAHQAVALSNLELPKRWKLLRACSAQSQLAAIDDQAPCC